MDNPDIDKLDALLLGSDERSKLLLKYKNYWAARAKEAEKDQERLRWLLSEPGVFIVSEHHHHGFEWDGDNYSCKSVEHIDIAMVPAK